VLLPVEQLRSCLAEPFSRDWLVRVVKAAADLPTASPNMRVAVYVLRSVCYEVACYMDAMEPVASTRHNQIESVLKPEVDSVIACLVGFREVGMERLASLIVASESIRILAK